jgi:predicted flap endonuclease-1-like 5' DNA nuclease
MTATTVIVGLIMLFIGFLVGWLMEWQIDLGYWRSYFKEVDEEAQAQEPVVMLSATPAPAQLPAAGQEIIIETLREQMAQRDSDLDTLRATIEQLSASEGRWRQREAELLNEARALRAELDRLTEARNDSDAEWRHELARREQQWQESKEAESAALRAENQHLKTHSAEALTAAENQWRAELARREQQWHTRSDGESAALRAEAARLTAKLNDVEKRFAHYKLHHPATLAEIIGIGPKIEEELRRAGIHTYHDLAQRTPEDLQALLNPPRWRKLDFEGWIAQAQQLAQQEI